MCSVHIRDTRGLCRRWSTCVLWSLPFCHQGDILGTPKPMNEQEQRTTLECPACESDRAAIVASLPPKAKCVDCGMTYNIETIPDPDLKKLNGTRTAAPGARHRRDNGPAELAVTPVPPPDPKDLGT